MHEVKKPRKPLIFYYVIVMVVLMLFNLLVTPYINQPEIQDVDYGTFMSMTENQQIGQVQVQQQENYILFTDKEGTTFYRTGMMPDDNLTQRLYDSGAEFNGEIIEQTDPWITILISWVLPIFIFIALGQYLSKKMMKMCIRDRHRAKTVFSGSDRHYNVLSMAGKCQRAEKCGRMRSEHMRRGTHLFRTPYDFTGESRHCKGHIERKAGKGRKRHNTRSSVQ